MSGDLLALGAKYVALTEEIEAVRRAMLACLTNGAGEHPTRPPQPARSAGGPSQSQKMAMAAEAEAKILELLKSQPGLGTAAVAKATASKTNTVAQRLQRLRDKGAITGGGNEGWVAAS